MSNVISGKDSLHSSDNKTPDSLILPRCIGNQMLDHWDPVANNQLPIFQGASISNCTFNIQIFNSANSPPPAPVKRRRIIFDDDEE